MSHPTLCTLSVPAADLRRGDWLHVMHDDPHELLWCRVTAIYVAGERVAVALSGVEAVELPAAVPVEIERAAVPAPGRAA